MRSYGLRILMSLVVVITLSAGCEFTSGGDSGKSVSFVVDVLSRGSGFKLDTWGGDRMAPDPWPYPGVTAHNVNRAMRLKKFSLSADGSILSFKACLDEGESIGRMWMTVTMVGDADLLTPPNLVNAKGESVFVIGPLGLEQCQQIDLDLDPWGGSSYHLVIDFLAIDPRVAFHSSHDPKHSLLIDAYSVGEDGDDLYQFTHTADYTNGFSAWSPAGEWIGYSRFEQTPCGLDTKLRFQTYVMHPDGSNLKPISAGMFNAASPSFSPDGHLVAFACVFDCVTLVNNICLYDLDTDLVRVLFRGDSYAGRNLHNPDWSPNGKIMTFSSNGPASGTLAHSIFYAPMDPITGDSLGSPILLMQQGVSRLLPDGKNYFINPRSWNWAPDSRHGALSCIYKVWNLGAWRIIHEGIVIVDFQAMLDTGLLPAVPKITPINNHCRKNSTYCPSPDPASFYPNFGPGGDIIYFDRPITATVADLMFVELADYVPVTGDAVTFYNDGFENRVPATFPPIKPQFYPSWP